ncbi:MAG: NAD(P)/FAD-dependent oxidoreductase [Actinomycetota bacterium]|nr:NAD(P)/FAD-dependent oxidoreductase [Actinomycetota bacterium]MDD5667181.1 NAD(P)/FAD-dependent oxidoreductase [Actinomycetota bacterium]
MRAQWDVIVVGAGPGGSTAAARLAQAGVDVLLVDKERFPREKPCSDIYGPFGARTYEELGVYERLLEAGYVYPGVLLSSPDYTAIYGANGKGLTCPRRVGDNILKENASRLGAEVWEEFWVHDLVVKDGQVRGVRAKYQGEFRDYRCDVVIGADGSHSWVAKRLGLFVDDYDQVYLAGRAYWRGCSPPLRDVEVHYDPSFNPGFVCLSPHPGYDDVVNMGVGIQMSQYGRLSLNAEEMVEKFVAESPHGEKMRGAERVSDWTGWRVPSAGQIGKNYAAGAVLVGDAGNFVEPFILEGVASAVRSANYAARAVLAALEERDFSEDSLSRYGEKWEKKMGPQLRALQGMAVTAADADALNGLFGGLKDDPEAVSRVFGE